METKSFIILAENKVSVEHQIEKLNKRANKVGIEPLTFFCGKAYVETREVIFQDPQDSDATPQYIKKDVLVIHITINGQFDVSYDGWQFIATLQHLPTGENIIRSISDEFEIPKQYRTAGPDCQHCNLKRYRKDTYIVRHETGAFVQVGSSCVQQFLGGDSPDDILNRANFIAELVTFMHGSGSGGGAFISGEELFHIESFLAQTSACIRDYGWVPKSKATPSQPATVYHVEQSLSYPGSVITQSDKDKAILVSEWAENISDVECDKSDYLYNIRAIARSGMVGRRTFGFAASMIAAYNNAHSSQSVSKHIGTVKSKIVVPLELKRHFSFSSYYGQTHKFIFHDSNGNIFTWSTSTDKQLEEGKTYNVKATIKAHTTYKNVCQTELTRCEII